MFETRGHAGPMTKTVLVVDDRLPARRLMNLAFRDQYRVLEAHDPDSAMTLLEQERVDLVLLDLHLPPALNSPEEGLRTYVRIREQSPEVPVVVVTSNDDPSIRDLLLRGGVHGFFTKPFDAQALVEFVQKLLRD